MPSSKTILKDLSERTSPHGTVMAVSMMKDEAPFLLEWIAHHLAVGFTDILVYTNDCTDGTVEMLQRLEEMGLAIHRPNDIPEGVKPQPSAINHAQAEPLVRKADWVVLFDADEFLCINHPSGTLDGVLDDVVARGANGLVITWRIFGSAGITDWSRAPVTEQYTRAAPPTWNKGWGVKTLFQFDHKYWKLGIHRPSIKNKWLETEFPDSVKWLNGSGLPMEEYFRFRGWRSIRRTVGYDWVQMNHYAVKSIDSYAVRKFRGNVNLKKDKYNADYWALQDRNEVEDRAILRHADRRAEIMAALLDDKTLRDLHEAALDAIEARLAEFKQTEAYTDLRDSLIEAGKRPIEKVEAKPPKARDPAKIAELMARVQATPEEGDAPTQTRAFDGWGKAEAGSYLPPPFDLSEKTEVVWIANHEIGLPADARLFTPPALGALMRGRFERRHARNIDGYLKGCHRMLEIGAGLCFVAIKALRDDPALVVLAQDDRGGLIDVAREVAARNGMDDTTRLKLAEGPLRLTGDKGARASGLAAYLKDFRPDALRLSAPEALPPETLAASDLSRLTRVILPFETAEGEALLRARYADVLNAAGLVEVEGRAGSGSLQFDRSDG